MNLRGDLARSRLLLVALRCLIEIQSKLAQGIILCAQSSFQYRFMIHEYISKVLNQQTQNMDNLPILDRRSFKCPRLGPRDGRSVLMWQRTPESAHAPQGLFLSHLSFFRWHSWQAKPGSCRGRNVFMLLSIYDITILLLLREWISEILSNSYVPCMWQSR